MKVKLFTLFEHIANNILKKCQQTPKTEGEWINVADDFEKKWNFPNCIGALDGKHITMRCPKNSSSMNFNYKHTFSIVLMALADANYKFIYVDVGCKGRISDGGVFNRCSLYNAIENNQLNIPLPRCLPRSNIETPFVIVADDAFALKSYLMKPYNFRGQDRTELIFNYRLSRARRIVESSFGIAAARFRVLRTTIELSEQNVILCVLAICAMHNWLMSIDSSFSEDIEPLLNETNINVNRNERATNDAKNIRELFKQYFNSDEGAVGWQNEKV